MDNMQCCGIEPFFDGKEADKDFAAYRKKGPVKTTRMLIDALKADGVQGSTLLDIGGGVGAIQHELLKAGAASAVSIEAATAYMEAARDEADRQGVADRLVQRHGNFVAMAQELEEADIVTLDRVVCCYDDMEGLVGLSLEKARGCTPWSTRGTRGPPRLCCGSRIYTTGYAGVPSASFSIRRRPSIGWSRAMGSSSNSTRRRGYGTWRSTVGQGHRPRDYELISKVADGGSAESRLFGTLVGDWG